MAVVSGSRALTYAELDAYSSRVAHQLLERGVIKGALVAVAFERSVELLVAVVAVMKAGGAYVPVDPAYPPERLAFILEDARPAIVLTQADMATALPPCELLVVDVEEHSPVPAVSPPASQYRVGPDDLAYVIYTSGSTGRPKGVMITHRGLTNLLETMAQEPGLDAGETMVGVTTPAFDLSVPDLYLPLFTGARLVLASREEAADPDALAGLLERFEARLMQATPATWRMLVDAGWSGREQLRVVCGGEALPPQLATRLAERVGALWNFYGPTEATVWSTCARVGTDGSVSIGTPLPNTSCVLLDAGGRVVPDGTPGELCIGGVGVARGYLNRPELTDERFVPDRVSGLETPLLYRTGDQARRRPDGTLEFLGRLDDQVKIRGFRVELGEIEATLNRHPAVAQAVALLVEADAEDPRLVAYVVPEAGKDTAARDLRRFVRDHLPSYMVPATIVAVDGFPLTPNGKIDRKALPAADRDLDDEPDRHVVPPRTPLERRLVEIWQDVLGIGSIGVTDDFFELGVDSLTAARLFARIEHTFGEKLPLAPVFRAPTVERLAELLSDQEGTAPRCSSLVPLRETGSRPPLFCVHGGAGTILLYSELARRLGPEQPVYGLQAVGLYGGEAPQTSVPKMAARYVEELTAAVPVGPYLLGGYCYGGLVTFEMAHQLRAQGAEVALVAMFNAPSPTYNRRYNPVFNEEGALTDAHGEFVLDQPPRDPRIRASLRRQWAAGDRRRGLWRVCTAASRRARVTTRAAVARLRFRYALRFRRPLPDDMRENLYFQRLAWMAQQAYEPQPLDGRLLVFRAAGLYHEEDLGWRTFVHGDVECREIPGDHAIPRDSMREPQVAFVAARLAEAAQRAIADSGHA